MTTRDGTQERTLDPPDEMLSDADLRECERAARKGFDCMGERAWAWIAEQLADTPLDMRELARTAILCSVRDYGTCADIDNCVSDLRDRYVAECAEEYWGDLIEQEKYAQEP